MDPAVLAITRFDQGNLLDFEHGRRWIAESDLVSCQHVLIYFREAAAAELLEAMAQTLTAQALLVVSPVEAHLLDRIPCLEPCGCIGVARRRAPHAARPRAVPAPKPPRPVGAPVAASSPRPPVAASSPRPPERSWIDRSLHDAFDHLAALRAGAERGPRGLLQRAEPPAGAPGRGASAAVGRTHPGSAGASGTVGRGRQPGAGRVAAFGGRAQHRAAAHRREASLGWAGGRMTPLPSPRLPSPRLNVPAGIAEGLQARAKLLAEEAGAGDEEAPKVFVTFCLDGDRYAVELDMVDRAVVRLGNVVALAGATGGVRGVAFIGNLPHVVLDLEQRFAGASRKREDLALAPALVLRAVNARVAVAIAGPVELTEASAAPIRSAKDTLTEHEGAAFELSHQLPDQALVLSSVWLRRWTSALRPTGSR